MKDVKTKAKTAVKDTSKKLKNLEEFTDAVALSVIDAFTLHQAYTRRHEDVLYVALGCFGAWVTFQAFRAWNKALDK